MQVVICSIFRNAEGYVRRYFEQAFGLAAALEARGDTLRFNLAEGDSADRTNELIAEHLQRTRNPEHSRFIKRDHGGLEYGSVVKVARQIQSTWVWNGVWDGLRLDDDVVVYVEGDLMWKPEAIVRLIDQIGLKKVFGRGLKQADTVIQYSPIYDILTDAVCPMIWINPEHEGFYDTWAYRRRGINFVARSPFHPDLEGHEGLLELDAAGSCIVMSGDCAWASKFEPPELQIVGMCYDMRQKGFRLWLDPKADVEHP